MIRSLWHRASGASPAAANTALTATTNIGLAALGMASGILAARLLGPQGRGELSAIQTWPAFVANLAVLGMPEALVYFSARTPGEAGRYLIIAIAASLVCSIPIIGVSLWLTPWILHAQTLTVVTAGRWYLIGFTIVSVFIGMAINPLRGIGDFVSWNGLRLGPPLAWIAVLLIAWFKGRTSAIFVAYGNLLGLILLFFPFMLIILKRLHGSFALDFAKLPSMLRFGIPCMMSGAPFWLNVRLDQMMMAAFVPSRELGLYAVAVAWSGAVAPVLSAMGAVTLPAVASGSNLSEGAKRLAIRSRMAVVVGLGACAVVTLVTPIAILMLFGRSFHTSVSAAIVLVPAATLLGFNVVLHDGLRGLGRPYVPLYVELIRTLW